MDQKTYRLPIFHCIVACIASLILGIGIGMSLVIMGENEVVSAPVVTQAPTPKYTPTPTLRPEDSITITLFFNNSNFNPQAQECSAVFPVIRRVAKTNIPLETTLELLFAGPTEEEISLGYNSVFSENTKDMLKSVNFKDGTVFLDFKEAGLLEAVKSGANSSCGGAQFGASIEKTLKGVNGVKTVLTKNFSVEGDKKAFQNLMQ